MNIYEIKFTLENIKIVENLLPPSVLEIFGVIGTEKGIALLNEYSGQRLPFTKGRFDSAISKRKKAELSNVIGEVAAERLIYSVFKSCGENFINMPTCLHARKKLRNICILNDYDEMARNGLSDIKAVDKLCKKYNLSHRAIRYILKGN